MDTFVTSAAQWDEALLRVHLINTKDEENHFN
jgi:hypothetical protein